jgi:hypothetical protein
VHKTTLLVNDAKIRKAQRVLGTKGIRDTIERALDEVIASNARARAVERLLRLEGIDRDVLLKARHEAWR